MVVEAGAARSLFIVAGGGAKQGSGHVMRCIPVADAWLAAGGSVWFFIPETARALASRIEAAGHATNVLDPDGDGHGLSGFAAAVSHQRPSWVVIDGIRSAAAFCNAARRGGARVLAFDDDGSCTAAPDILVNPNLGACASAYRALPGKPHLLLGTAFAPLRPEFHMVEPAERRAGRLLITMGGADPFRMTERLVEAMRTTDWKIQAVVGPLRNPAVRLKGVDVLVAPADMAVIMARCDAAIICAGGTLWELLHLGRVVFSYHFMRVQQGIIGSLAAAGIIIDAGPVDEFDAAHAALQLDDQRRIDEVARAAKLWGPLLVDGRGAARIVASMLGEPEIRAGPVAVPIGPNHLEGLRRILDEPAVQASFQRLKPTAEDHEAWFHRQQVDPSSRHLAIIDDGRVVGGCGIKDIKDRCGELFIYLGADAHGRGLGRRAMVDLLEVANHLQISRLVLWVSQDNAAAIGLYVRFGFVPTADVKERTWQGRKVFMRRMALTL